MVVWVETGLGSYFVGRVNEVQRGYGLVQDLLARRWQGQTEACLWLRNSVLAAVLAWFWPSFRDYGKEMWANPDHFSNIPRHCVFTINGKALILATWNWSCLPIVSKKQLCYTLLTARKHDTLSLRRLLLFLLWPGPWVISLKSVPVLEILSKGAKW